VGATVLHNLMAGGFKGQLYPVNPKYDRTRRPAAWPTSPTCRGAGPGHHLHAAGHRARSSGAGRAGHARRHRHERRPGHARDLRGRSLKQAMLDAANPYLLRILGPNSAGLLAPASA
jgi:acetyltransferase